MRPSRFGPHRLAVERSPNRCVSTARRARRNSSRFSVRKCAAAAALWEAGEPSWAEAVAAAVTVAAVVYLPQAAPAVAVEANLRADRAVRSPVVPSRLAAWAAREEAAVQWLPWVARPAAGHRLAGYGVRQALCGRQRPGVRVPAGEEAVAAAAAGLPPAPRAPLWDLKASAQLPGSLVAAEAAAAAAAAVAREAVPAA